MQPQSPTVKNTFPTGSDAPVDIFVIGGGINGCGIARDAVGRGYSVSLAEMNDLGSGTSSWSTKLIHGGLRYLEHYEFRLVRESLMEREVLWKNAPHVIRPMRFILPHHKGLRPAWLLRLGLFLYDNLGGRKLLPPTSVVDMSRDEASKPLKPLFTKGFEYSDCTVDDVRMVILNAQDAADRGAEILTRTQVTELRRDGDFWHITLRNTRTGAVTTRTARLVVNAAGPWVDRVLSGAAGKNDARNVRLVQGSHIVVKRLFEHERSYIFQNSDGRIIFAIPYEEDLTLIGTTDKDYAGGDSTADPGKAKITDEEIGYLCSAASEYFAKPITRDDVVWTYSGVRPLFDDGAGKAQEATRDYVLREQEADGPPLIIIFGGKITTFRRLAGSMLEKIEAKLGKKGDAWTATAALPGGDFPVTGHKDYVRQLATDYPFLADKHARRLTRLYGTKARDILADATSMADLGELFGHDLTEAEVRYAMANEWALTADDMLWRRTKLGLRFSSAQVDRLEDFMSNQLETRAAAAE
jgi:glycerol-3-phosphate dehydrogenase